MSAKFATSKPRRSLFPHLFSIFVLLGAVSLIATASASATTVTASKLAISFQQNGATVTKAALGSTVTVTVKAEGSTGAVATTGFLTTIVLGTTDTGDSWAATGSDTGTFAAPGDYTFAAGDAGVATFTLTLAPGLTFASGKTSGTDTITAALPYYNDITQGSQGLTVTAGPAAKFGVAITTKAPSANGSTCSATTATSGSQQCWINGETVSVNVTAEDAGGNTATGYTGATTLGTTDIDLVTYPHSTVTAYQIGNPTSYTFAAGDHGVKKFTLQFLGCPSLIYTAYSLGAPCADTLTAQGSVDSTTITGTDALHVVPGSATQLAISPPSDYTKATGIVEGTTSTYTVTPENAYGVPVDGFADKIHFSSSDTLADLPVPNTQAYKWTTSSGDNGTTYTPETFSVTLHSVGTKTITVKDAATGTKVKAGSVSIKSTAGPAHHLDIFADDNAENGSTLKVTVALMDKNDFPVTSGAGSVQLSSSYTGSTSYYNDNDGIPQAHALTNGVYTFSVTVKGCQTGTCEDTITATDGTYHEHDSLVVHVTPGAVTKFGVVAGGSGTGTKGTASVGAEVPGVSVTAENVYGQPVEDYRGTVHFSSSDASADLPGNYTFTGGPTTTGSCAQVATVTLSACDNGTATFNYAGDGYYLLPRYVVFYKTGTDTLTVKQVNRPTITGNAKVKVS